MPIYVPGKVVLRKGWQPMDPDAAAYITAVETADAQALEERTKIAIDNFVLGCKADGIWTAIKASCILAGARTLTGALVPLVGAAPTNVGGLFVSGDYNRKTGLVGDGSTKYLNSNRLRTAEPQDSYHLSVWASTLHTVGATGFYAGNGVEDVDGSATGLSHVGRLPTGNHYTRNTSTSSTDLGSPSAGFFGISRASSSSYTARQGGGNTIASQASEARPNTTNKIFAGRLLPGGLNGPASARLAFYSIGESLNLALLDARVTALITAFGVAIP